MIGPRREDIAIRNLIVRSLREDEETRLFVFARSLPDRDFWGKKGRYLRGDYGNFKKFFEYIKPFEPKCFLVAEEDNRLVGFVVAVYNPAWIMDLKKRYGYDVEKRAYILGITVIQRRKDVLKALTNEMANYFSQRGIESAEYPSLGGVCLTTGTDILTSENVDSLIIFREVGFKINECYYDMELDLGTYKEDREYWVGERAFRSKERGIEISEENEVLGRITWDAIEDGKTDVGIYVAPPHQGKGFGTALMAKALCRLKTEGVRIIELGVDGNNLPALKLYRKFGFDVAKTHFYILVRFEDLILRSTTDSGSV